MRVIKILLPSDKKGYGPDSSKVILVGIIQRHPSPNYVSDNILVKNYYNYVISVNMIHWPKYVSGRIRLENYYNYINDIILKCYMTAENLEIWHHILIENDVPSM